VSFQQQAAALNMVLNIMNALADVAPKVADAVGRTPDTLRDLGLSGAIDGGRDILNITPTTPSRGFGSSGVAIGGGGGAAVAASQTEAALRKINSLRSGFESRQREMVESFLQYSVLAGYVAQMAEIRLRLEKATNVMEIQHLRGLMQQISREIVSRFGASRAKFFLTQLQGRGGAQFATDILEQYRRGVA
jgi:hypothetical protein